ncbi:secreted protein, partial [marine sediment metagenome]
MTTTEAHMSRLSFKGSLIRNLILATAVLLASVTMAVSVGAVSVPASTV